MNVTKRFNKFLIDESGESHSRCESCGKLRPQNVMIYDVLWSKIRKQTGCDFLCQDCIEEALGRKLTLDDLKYQNESTEDSLIMIPCNFKLCNELNKDRKVNLRYYTYNEFKNKKCYSLLSKSTVRKMYLEMYYEYLNEYERG